MDKPSIGPKKLTESDKQENILKIRQDILHKENMHYDTIFFYLQIRQISQKLKKQKIFEKQECILYN